MVKSEIKALAGFEAEFDNFNRRLENLEFDIETAKNEAVAKVEEQFADTKNKLVYLLEQVSEVVEVEVQEQPIIEEEIVEEVAHEVENIEEV